MDEPAERAHQLSLRGESFAVATVVRAERPASAKPGMKAIILPDGTLEGWVGGSCTHPVVIREALLSLRSGAPRLISLIPEGREDRREGVIHHPMTCHSGGSLEIYIEPVLPNPQLLLMGEAPLVGILAELGRMQGFTVWATRAGEEVQSKITPSTYVVVATMGAYDEEALEHVVGSRAAYVALVASRKRAETVFAYLTSRGVSPDQLQPIKIPAGLDIGAITPEEIALSIMAEIIQVRRARPATPIEPPPPEPATAAEVEEARDPVCGMSVRVAGARYTSDFQGVRFYFCGASCKAAFDRDPAKYTMVKMPSGPAF